MVDKKKTYNIAYTKIDLFSGWRKGGSAWWTGQRILEARWLGGTPRGGVKDALWRPSTSVLSSKVAEWRCLMMPRQGVFPNAE